MARVRYLKRAGDSNVYSWSSEEEEEETSHIFRRDIAMTETIDGKYELSNPSEAKSLAMEQKRIREYADRVDKVWLY